MLREGERERGYIIRPDFMHQNAYHPITHIRETSGGEGIHPLTMGGVGAAIIQSVHTPMATGEKRNYSVGAETGLELNCGGSCIVL